MLKLMALLIYTLLKKKQQQKQQWATLQHAPAGTISKEFGGGNPNPAQKRLSIKIFRSRISFLPYG